MPLSSSTLNAIQKVGAAAFTADDKLKKEVQSYAERVNLAMFKNPYNLGNDALIEAWKVVARLSQTMMGIEEELKTIHRIASELTQDDQPSVRDTPALAAPVAKKMAKKIDAAVTTVKVKGMAKKAVPAKPVAATASVAGTAKVPAKRRVAQRLAVVPATTPVKAKAAPVKVVKKASADTAKVTAKAKSHKTKAAGTPVQTQDLQGNSAKLMAQLQGVLSTAGFTNINQSAVAKVAGIPVGSMGATIGRLVKAGRIVSGTNGSLKLTATPAATPSAVQTALQPVAAMPAESAAQA
jgi:hypothetical protein